MWIITTWYPWSREVKPDWAANVFVRMFFFLTYSWIYICRVGYMHVVPFQFELHFPSLNSRFCYKRTRWTMRECHKDILQRLIGGLLRDLEPEPQLLYLYQWQVIDKDDMDEIRSWKVPKYRSEALIFKLMKKGPQAFSKLVDGLQNKQPFLACSLLQEG